MLQVNLFVIGGVNFTGKANTSRPEATLAASRSDAFKPSRRVRSVPGGGHTDIFSAEAEDDALSTAPLKAGIKV